MTDERPTPETDELSQSIITHNNTYACYEQMKMHARCLERERDEARKEIENIKKLLLDPNAVHINMLHGQIAKLDWEKLEHIHGNHPAREQLATERAIADRLAALLHRNRDLYGGQQVDYQCGCSDCEYLGPIDDALAAWKESRSEV